MIKLFAIPISNRVTFHLRNLFNPIRFFLIQFPQITQIHTDDYSRNKLSTGNPHEQVEDIRSLPTHYPQALVAAHYLFSKSTTFSTWCVWGNISTGCTAETL